MAFVIGNGWRGNWEDPNPRDRDYWLQLEEAIQERNLYLLSIGGNTFGMLNSTFMTSNDISVSYINTIWSYINNFFVTYYSARALRPEKVTLEGLSNYFSKLYKGEIITEEDNIYYNMSILINEYTGDSFEWLSHKGIYSETCNINLKNIMKFFYYAINKIIMFEVSGISGYTKPYVYAGSSNLVDGTEMPVINTYTSDFLGTYGADKTILEEGAICQTNGFGGSITIPEELVSCTSSIFTDSRKYRTKNGWNLTEACSFYQHTHIPNTLCGKEPDKTYNDYESSVALGITNGVAIDQSIVGWRQIEDLSPDVVYPIIACNCAWETFGEEQIWVCNPTYSETPEYPDVFYYVMNAQYKSNYLSLSVINESTYQAFFCLYNSLGYLDVPADYGPDENGNSTKYRSFLEGLNVSKRGTTNETFYEFESGNLTFNSEYSLQEYNMFSLETINPYFQWLNSACIQPTIKQGRSYAALTYGANIQTFHTITAEFIYQ